MHASGGGGSGGMIVLDAQRIDLTQASPNALDALGGPGGVGAGPDGAGAGGDGGPGLVQLHVPDPTRDVELPPGVPLADLTAPDAHVLLPAKL